MSASCLTRSCDVLALVKVKRVNTSRQQQDADTGRAGEGRREVAPRITEDKRGPDDDAGVKFAWRHRRRGVSSPCQQFFLSLSMICWQIKINIIWLLIHWEIFLQWLWKIAVRRHGASFFAAITKTVCSLRKVLLPTEVLLYLAF